jgi:hypothetical protein
VQLWTSAGVTPHSRLRVSIYAGGEDEARSAHVAGGPRRGTAGHTLAKQRRALQTHLHWRNVPLGGRTKQLRVPLRVTMETLAAFSSIALGKELSGKGKVSASRRQGRAVTQTADFNACRTRRSECMVTVPVTLECPALLALLPTVCPLQPTWSEHRARTCLQVSSSPQQSRCLPSPCRPCSGGCTPRCEACAQGCRVENRM